MLNDAKEQCTEPHAKSGVSTAYKWHIKYDDSSNDLILADLVPDSSHNHLFTATATLTGKGECKAWLIKPELVDFNDYAQFQLSPDDTKDLLYEIFDWPRPGMDQTEGTFHHHHHNKGVKFLQQFDVDYDYLEEELDDIRDYAWVLLFRHIHVEQDVRRQGVGTALVRALVQEIVKLAHQLEERPVLAFVKSLGKSAVSRPLAAETRDIRPPSPSLSPSPPPSAPALFPADAPCPESTPEKDIQEAKIQGFFWQSLAFERLNDGQLFAKDLDWLLWSPRARNAAMLFERAAAAFPIDFDAWIDGDLDEGGQYQRTTLNRTSMNGLGIG